MRSAARGRAGRARAARSTRSWPAARVAGGSSGSGSSGPPFGAARWAQRGPAAITVRPGRSVELAAELGQRPFQRLARRVGRVGVRRTASSSAIVPSWTSAASSAIVRISTIERTTKARSPTSRGRARRRRSTRPTRRLDRRRPVERIAVAEIRRRAVLEQVAGEQHVGVRDEDDDVVVGVAATEVAQLDPAPAGVEVDRRRARRTSGRADRGRPRPVGRRASGIAAATRAIWSRAGLADHRGAAGVAPDRRGPEAVVAEGVVVVAVGVDDGRDRAAA